LASAARVGGLAALSAQEGFIRVKRTILKSLFARSRGFLLKPKEYDPLRKYAIKALHHHVPDDDPVRLLCPVGAVRLYLKGPTRPQGTESNCSSLCCLDPSMRLELLLSLDGFGIQSSLPTNRKTPLRSRSFAEFSPHEVRTIATSLVTWKNVPIHNILKVAFWRNHNTLSGCLPLTYDCFHKEASY
jgi:hypothetical protein